MRCAVTYFKSLRDPQGKRHVTSWPALCRWLSAPVVSADKHDVGGFSVATYVGDRRSLAGVDEVFALGLDLDHGVTLDDLRARFVASAAMVHTTWSSTLAAPRARVFLLLSRPVGASDYRRVYQAVAGQVEAGGIEVDRAASDASRFWFRPSIPPGGAMVYWASDGPPVDVEAALAAVPELPPPPAPSGPRQTPVGVDAYDRAKAYLEKCPGAVSGSGGHAQTFAIAQRMVRGFALSNDDAYRLLCDWNTRCSPPWSERELRRKVDQAANTGRANVGDMLERQR